MCFFGRVVEKIVEENTQATQKGFQLPSHSWSMDPLEATECLRFLWSYAQHSESTPGLSR